MISAILETPRVVRVARVVRVVRWRGRARRQRSRRGRFWSGRGGFRSGSLLPAIGKNPIAVVRRKSAACENEEDATGCAPAAAVGNQHAARELDALRFCKQR